MSEPAMCETEILQRAVEAYLAMLPKGLKEDAILALETLCQASAREMQRCVSADRALVQAHRRVAEYRAKDATQ